MRLGRAVLLYALLLAMAPPPAARAAEPSTRPDVELFFDRWVILAEPRYSLGLETIKGVDDLLFEPPAPLAGLPGVRFDTAFTEKEVPAFAGAEPGWRLIDLKARGSARVWGGRLGSESEVLGYATHDASEAEPVAETAPRLIRFGLTETWGRLQSGIRFESVSLGLQKITGAKIRADREGSEAWLAVRTDALRLKTSVSEFSDNVADDPRRERTTRSEVKGSVELTLPGGPLVGLSVARGIAVSVPAPRGGGRHAGSESSDFDRAAVSFYHYGGPVWDVAFSTTYTVNAGAGQDSWETAWLSHDVSGTYRPAAAARLSPALSLWQEAFGTGTDTEGLSASLSLAMTPLIDAFDMSVYGGYTRMSTTDGAFDGRSLDATASLIWNLRRSRPRTTLSFEIGYHQYLEAASGAGRYAELVGQLILRLAEF